MSGAAAVIAAGRRPDLVCGLVLVCPFLRGPQSRVKTLVQRTMLGIALMRPWGPAVWNSYSARLWPGLPDARQRATSLVDLLRRPGRWRRFLGYDSHRSPRRHPLAGQGGLSCPRGHGTEGPRLEGSHG